MPFVSANGAASYQPGETLRALPQVSNRKDKARAESPCHIPIQISIHPANNMFSEATLDAIIRPGSGYGFKSESPPCRFRRRPFTSIRWGRSTGTRSIDKKAIVSSYEPTHPRDHRGFSDCRIPQRGNASQPRVGPPRSYPG